MNYRYREGDIFVDVCGEGAALILLHGWGCDNTIYKSCKGYLATWYRVYALDLPGFGGSDEPDCVWGTQDYADMLEHFIHNNNIKNPSLVGHSFGGRVSILYASQHSDVDKLVLIDSAGIVPKRGAKYYTKVYSYKFMKHLCRILPKSMAEQVLESRRKSAGSSDYNNASPRMRQIMSKVVNEDLKCVMPNIKASTLLFWGDLDTSTPLSDAETMERLIPDVGKVIAKGCGHFSFIEMPTLFDSVMKSLFNIKQ